MVSRRIDRYGKSPQVPIRPAVTRVSLNLLGVWLGIALLSAACASTGGVPRPFPMPGGAPSASGRPAPPTPAEGRAVVGTALQLRGAPYRNGGTDPTGFDCSGLTQYVFAKNGISLPRAVREQFQVGKQVPAEALAPGDLIFFSTVAPGPSHVAISIGGDEFIHAPSSSGVVRVEHLSAAYWARRYLGARRIN
jgi:cell wall-associated NlpC family hydrolase